MKKLLVLFLIVCVLGPTTYGATRTSSTSGLWSNTATWGGDPVPVAGDDVVLNHAVSITNFNAECTSITANTNGELILATATLKIGAGGIDWNSTNGSILLSADSKVQLVAATLIPIDCQTELAFNGAGLVEIGEVGTGAGVVLNSNSGTENMLIYGVLAVIQGDFSTNNQLVLKSTNTTTYGRIALTDGTTPIGSRVVYTGTITGDVTMEKELATTLLPSLPSVTDPATNTQVSNGTWFQFCLPLVANWSDLSGVTINDHSHTPAYQKNIYHFREQSSGIPAGSIGGNATEKALGWAVVSNQTSVNQDTAVTLFLTSGPPYQASNNVSLTGTADLTSKTFNLYYTHDLNGNDVNNADQHGWNHVRNPWPSLIDTEEWLNSTTDYGSAYRTIHIWNSIATNGANAGQSDFSGHYQAWTITSQAIPAIDYNTSGGITYTPASAGERIPPFQAFWVKLDAQRWAAAGNQSPTASTTVPCVLDKKYSITDINGKNYQKTSGTSPEVLGLLAYDEDSLRDITMVYWNQDATDNFDLSGDIYKLRSPLTTVPNLMIIEGGSETMSAGRTIKAVDTLEVLFQSYKNNSAAYLYLNDTGLTNTYSVTLYDKLTTTSVNMRQNPYYYFTHNTSNAENRFQLIINNSAVGIDEQVKSESLDAHIVNNELVINSIDYEGEVNAVVYDMAGRFITNQIFTIDAQSEMKFSLPDLCPGIYIIDLTFNGSQIVKKVIQ